MEQEKNKQEQAAVKQGSSPVDISQLSEEQKASLLAQLNAEAKNERINKRVDLMLEAGLEQEVRSLLEQGVAPECQSMQSIGYRQMVWYLNGSMDYAAAVDKLKQATRNFAKRQITWYKKMPYIHWLHLDDEPDYKQAVADISEILVESGISV